MRPEPNEDGEIHLEFVDGSDEITVAFKEKGKISTKICISSEAAIEIGHRLIEIGLEAHRADCDNCQSAIGSADGVKH